MSALATRRRRPRIGRPLAWAALGLIIVVTVFPFYWVLRTALSTNPSLFTAGASLLPPEFTDVNVRRVLGLATREEVAAVGGAPVEFRFLLYLRNSVIVSTVITVGQVTFCAMAAYAFARLRFRGRNGLFVLFLSALMVPPVFVLIPNFILMRELGWVGTFRGLVAPFVLMTPFTVFLLRQFFLGINAEIEDAARVDGAGHFRIFTRIDVPLMTAPIAMVAILTYIIAWNEYMWPLVVGRGESVRVLTVGLALFSAGTPADRPDWSGLMAGTLLAVLPIILLLLVAGRRVVDSIQFSGIK